MDSQNLNGKYETISTKDNPEKIERMAELMKEILSLTSNYSENQSKEIIEKTPKRFIKYLLESSEGYTINIDDIVKDALFEVNNYKDIIIVSDISFNSTCEHHLLPFFGECSIGYIPENKVLGLSKFPRVVEAISKKFYLQENLTRDIATILDSYLKCAGVVVIISAKHSCMCYRGIRSYNSETKTIFKTGLFNQT